MRRARGLSLLETLTGLFILTLVAWSVIYLYASLLRGSKTGDARRKAVSEAETVLAIWKTRARTPWLIDDTNVEAESYSASGTISEYTYRVEVGSRLPNPSYAPGDPESKPYLNLRLLHVELEYEDHEQSKRVKLVGSVAK